ncbi:MAG: 1-acyl-sn-glycerol-3-phosphate acyltransferase [Dysgonamonadaceae bacterium]|jgi:putative hemolysin|nr:1-acyl-sn-glycerol-3-phosphate acyltransferase [Dysgonamonadaceae bacterium]
MNAKSAFRIDIDGILRAKMPRHYKLIPRFLINYLKRTIHQDEINGVLDRNSDVEGVAFMKRLVDKEFNIKIKIEGEENIPIEGRFVFVSNHPLGGMDGICLSAFLGEKYEGKIKYLVNDILYFLKPLQPIFVPINKHGSQAKDSAQAINEAYASDDQVITFPSGMVSRKQKGKIRDLTWHKSFVMKAIESKRDMIPVYFSGQNSNFFYNLANIRKMLGIKFNIEMLYLPDEMFNSKNKTFTITFGKPIPWQTFDKSKTFVEWAQYVKEMVYSLP